MKLPFIITLVALLLFPATESWAKEKKLSLKQFDKLTTPPAGDVYNVKAYLSEFKLDQCKPCPKNTLCDYCLPPSLTLTVNEKSQDIEDVITIPLHHSASGLKLEREKSYTFQLKPFYHPDKPGALPDYDLIGAELSQ